MSVAAFPLPVWASCVAQAKWWQPDVLQHANRQSRSVSHHLVHPPMSSLWALAEEPQKDRIFLFYLRPTRVLPFFGIVKFSVPGLPWWWFGTGSAALPLWSLDWPRGSSAPDLRVWKSRRGRRPPCLGPGYRMRWRCRGGLTTGEFLDSARLPFPLRCIWILTSCVGLPESMSSCYNFAEWIDFGLIFGEQESGDGKIYARFQPRGDTRCWRIACAIVLFTSRSGRGPIESFDPIWLWILVALLDRG